MKHFCWIFLLIFIFNCISEHVLIVLRGYLYKKKLTIKLKYDISVSYHNYNATVYYQVICKSNLGNCHRWSFNYQLLIFIIEPLPMGFFPWPTMNVLWFNTSRRGQVPKVYRIFYLERFYSWVGSLVPWIKSYRRLYGGSQILHSDIHWPISPLLHKVQGSDLQGLLI